MTFENKTGKYNKSVNKKKLSCGPYYILLVQITKYNCFTTFLIYGSILLNTID